MRFYRAVLSILTVSLFMITFGALAANPSDLPQMKTQMFDPSVRIGDYCSGTIIHSDRNKETGKVSTYVLLAKHCTKELEENTTVQIEQHNKRNNLTKTDVYTATVWGRDWKSDLALLKLTDEETYFENVAKIAPKEMEEELQFGQDVWLVAHPLGRSETLTVGSLGFQELDPGFKIGKTFYRATPDVAPGSSGSAMYTKDKGGNYVLIGVTTGGAMGFTFFNFFTPIDVINEYINTARKAW